MIRLENLLKTFSQDVSKMSWDELKTSSKRLEDISARHLEEVLKTSWRYLSKTSWRRFCKTSWKRLEDAWPRRIYWSWSRRLKDVFWRRMSKANTFVLIKTSQRRLEDVFWSRRRKTSFSRRMFTENVSGDVSTISSNVFLLFKWGIKTRFKIFIRTVLRLLSALVQWPQLLCLYLPGSQVL